MVVLAMWHTCAKYHGPFLFVEAQSIGMFYGEMCMGLGRSGTA